MQYSFILHRTARQRNLEAETFNYKVVAQKLENFCIHRQSITLLRYKFLTHKQKEDQSFDKFMTQLKFFFSGCEFGELKN